MRSSLLFVLALTLAPAMVHAQRDRPMGSDRVAVVRTVSTDTTMSAGTAIGGISVDALGRIYSATFRRKVYRIETNGTVTVLTTDFRQASGNTIDNQGELIQSEYQLNRLYRVHEDGSRTLITRMGLDGPVGVVMDEHDDLFVANFGNDTIARVAPDGTTTLFSNDPLLNGPNGITIDGLGDLYVVNFDDNLLLRLDPLGKASVVAAIGTLGTRNNAHVTALRGDLYVSKIFSHRIYRVSPDGHVQELVGDGTPGTLDGFAPGQATLYHPNGLTTDPAGGVLYTNNYIGKMGKFGSTLTVRAIHFR